MPIEATRMAILVKIESTYGVDPTPDETNVILVRDFKLKPNLAFADKPVIGPTRQSRGKTLARWLWDISFEVDLTGILTLDAGDFQAPKYAALLQACEMVEADVGAAPITGKTYSYTTRAAQPSVTIWVVQFKQSGDDAHNLIKINGVRLKHSISGAVGGVAVLKFEGHGLYTGIPVTGALDPALFDYGDQDENDDAVPLRGISLTVGGTDQDIKSIELMGNRKLEIRESALGAYGVKEIHVTAGAGDVFTLKLDAPVELVADYDFMTKVLAETKEALVIYFDSVQGHRFAVTASRLQRASWDYNPDTEILRLAQESHLCDATDGGDDAVIYTCSATP